jgi:hypothetical protein
MSRKLTPLVLFVALLFAGVGELTADKKPIPPTAKDLIGIWIGFDSDELTFTRLVMLGGRFG